MQIIHYSGEQVCYCLTFRPVHHLNGPFFLPKQIIHMKTETTSTTRRQTKYLGSFETEKAVQIIKDHFSKQLEINLQLQKVNAPLLIQQSTGLNDNLNGTEKAVKVKIKGLKQKDAVVVHSLAKWKRDKLKRYDIPEDKGIYTDMHALRQDEELSAIHSVFVDQWDWEVHLSSKERTIENLKKKVKSIYSSIRKTDRLLKTIYPQLMSKLAPEIFFIHSEELLNMYPEFSTKERENAIAKKHKAVFIIGIGGVLQNGEPHDGRAPDYDDWSSIDPESGYKGLNGDLIVWHPILEQAFELSSMGIRVNSESLQEQLTLSNTTERKDLPFHQKVLKNELTQSIGGGIGQSRLCMFLLNKRHIGEVQASVWPEYTTDALARDGIQLL